jgi:hypothetical protein
MIVQIDHVQLSSTAFEFHSRLLRRLGYQTLFTENGVRNLRIKRDLVRAFRETQDLSLLASEGNLGIELVNNGSVGPDEGLFIPVLVNVPPDLILKTEKARQGRVPVSLVMLKGLEVPVYISVAGGSTGFAFNQLVLRAEDVERSARFWRSLGFVASPDAGWGTTLQFSSLTRGHLFRMHLRRGHRLAARPRLDDKGFVCLAFVVTSAENEAMRLGREGFETTAAESITLNARKMNILFVRGPDGEIVELIEVAR